MVDTWPVRMTNLDTGEVVTTIVEVARSDRGLGPINSVDMPEGWLHGSMDIGPVLGIIVERKPAICKPRKGK